MFGLSKYCYKFYLAKIRPRLLPFFILALYYFRLSRLSCLFSSLSLAIPLVNFVRVTILASVVILVSSTSIFLAMLALSHPYYCLYLPCIPSACAACYSSLSVCFRKCKNSMPTVEETQKLCRH
jgi:hypothetical protein